MELSIIQRVARLVTSTKLDPANHGKKDSEKRVKSDSVAISETASDLRNVNDAIEQMPKENKERTEKISRLREAIQNGQYKMSESMINSIAERIANTLI